MLTLGLTSCCGDEDSDGLKGWYVNKSTVATQSDFTEINKAINNDEVLMSYRRQDVVASYNLFIKDNGYYSDVDPSCGRLRFKIKTHIRVIHMLNSNTLEEYNASLYVESKKTGKPVYKLYTGTVFGNMAYFDDSPRTYTYTVVDGNKIVVSNGDIYTISSGGLILDGTSGIMTKFDPEQRY